MLATTTDPTIPTSTAEKLAALKQKAAIESSTTTYDLLYIAVGIILGTPNIFLNYCEKLNHILFNWCIVQPQWKPIELVDLPKKAYPDICANCYLIHSKYGSCIRNRCGDCIHLGTQEPYYHILAHSIQTYIRMGDSSSLTTLHTMQWDTGFDLEVSTEQIRSIIALHLYKRILAAGDTYESRINRHNRASKHRSKT